MKLKEVFYKLGLRPNYRFYPTKKREIGSFNGQPVEFHQWMTPRGPVIAVDQGEIEELKSFLNEGDCAIDVGAHIGDSVLPIALACGKAGKVFAFEPNPVVFTTLCKNAFLNSELTHIIPIPFACTDNDAQLVFKYSDPALSNGGDKTNFGFRNGHTFPLSVDGVNPLGFLTERFKSDLEKIRYIKIDVEGLDFIVLKQFETLIDEQKPYIKFEIAKFTSGEMRKNLQGFFKDKAYKFYRVDEQKNRLFGHEISSSEFLHSKTCDIFCVPICESE